jgi:hydroxymethylbilane synthase
MWQANRVSQLISAAVPDVSVQLLPMTTVADRQADKPLRELGDKGLFTREIENALLEGRADAGVHSLKDVPGELPEGLVLAAIPERADARDVFLSNSGLQLPQMKIGSRIATSSLRRRGQALRLNPGIQVAEVRGNIETRMQKLRDGAYDGMILAAAGLLRIDSADDVVEYFSLDKFVPAAGQGALAVEAKSHDVFGDVWQAISNPPLQECIEAERTFVVAVGADCDTPVGCHCCLKDGEMQFTALICSPDGKKVLKKSAVCSPGANAGTYLAQSAAAEMLEDGGREILALARKS